MRSVLFVVIMALLVGCSATKQAKQQSLDKVVVINHSNKNIKNVAIYAKSISRKMQCGFIPKNGLCEYKFYKSQHTKNDFKITWTIGEQIYVHDDVTISNLKLNNNEAISIAFNILNNGTFQIYQN